MAPMMMDPEQAVEGGDFPRGDLLVLRAYYEIFHYMKQGAPVMNRNGQPATSVSAHLDLRNDDGVVFAQNYSIGDPSRFTIADGGDTIEGSLKTNCQFYQLMITLVDRGYPTTNLRDNPSIGENLVGLYASWEQETEKRGDSGLLVLPMGGIHQFPWAEAVKGAPKPPDVDEISQEEAKAGSSSAPATSTPAATKKTAVKKTTAKAATLADSEVIGKLVAAVQAGMEAEEVSTRGDLTSYVFANYEPEEKMDMMNLIMSADLTAALGEVEIGLEGEEFTVLTAA
jgi:hypothetical protein